MRLDRIIAITIQSIQKYQNWVEIILSLRKKRAPARVILRDGTRFAVTDVYLWRSLVDEIFLKRVYNPFHLEIERDEIVVDIGAHIGIFTVFAASKTQNTVYALEPSPSNFEVLKRNICVNGLNNVIAHRFAVSDKVSSSAALLLSSKTSTSHVLCDHIILDKLEKYQTSAEHLEFKDTMLGELEAYIEVPTTTLQNIMDSNNIEEIGFLKMDCEGSEGLILDATPRTYLKRIRKIAIEFHDHLSKIDHVGMQKLLEEVGFITSLKWDGKSPLGYLYGWRDYFLRKEFQ